MLRIALDIDDTVLNWRKAHEEKFKCHLGKIKSETVTKQVNSLKHNKDFWENLALLEKPDFIPELWCTKRINSKVYTRNSFRKTGLPIKPIIQFHNQSDNKAGGLIGKCDILVDDSWFNVNQCLEAGFPALLITRPHNKWVKTKYRVSHLSYKEIEKKYYELFR